MDPLDLDVEDRVRIKDDPAVPLKEVRCVSLVLCLDLCELLCE